MATDGATPGIAPDLPHVAVADDLVRLRIAVLFRGFLVIPHLLWLGGWGAGVLLLLPIHWGITLVKGRPNEGLHEVYALYTRYTLHVYAYATLAAEPFPGFLGRPGSYPVDLVVAPPTPQNRWTVALRAVLVLPPLVMSGAFGSGAVTTGGVAWLFGVGPAVVIPVLAWFACLVRGRMPAGFRDVLAWTLGYAVQVLAYLFLVTGAYPDADPRTTDLAPRPRHPVRLEPEADPGRHRLTVAFRGVLAMPHWFWLGGWSVVVLVLAPLAWLVALVLGRLPGPLHRFLAAYVRYATHVTAFAYLAGRLFPGFTGRRGSYPVDLDLDGPPERQGRWTIAFRWLLAVPALMLAAALGATMTVAAIGAWWFTLVRGRMPRGLHRTVDFCVRYTAQASAYALLLTPAYPHSGPSEEEAPLRTLAPPALVPGPLAELEAR